MVRSELLTLFKPALRWAFALNSAGTHQGVWEGSQTVLTQSTKQHKEEATLVKAFILLTSTTGKSKGKTGSMDGKKGTARGSKGKGKDKNQSSHLTIKIVAESILM